MTRKAVMDSHRLVAKVDSGGIKSPAQPGRATCPAGNHESGELEKLRAELAASSRKLHAEQAKNARLRAENTMQSQTLRACLEAAERQDSASVMGLLRAPKVASLAQETPPPWAQELKQQLQAQQGLLLKQQGVLQTLGQGAALQIPKNCTNMSTWEDAATCLECAVEVLKVHSQRASDERRDPLPLFYEG